MLLGLKLLLDELGASALEYCLLVTFIAVVIIAAVTALGNTLSGHYDTMAKALG
jgi:Flp pilus assembly pilin Flp